VKRFLLLAAFISLALPACALGAARYAAPGGGAAAGCPQASPCSLATAITGAAADDEVVVTPGTYAVASRIESTMPLNVHGIPGQPLPRIVGASGVTPLALSATVSLSYLAVEATESSQGAIAAIGSGDVFDHLELIGHGIATLALRPGFQFTLSDSLLTSDGETAALFVQGVESGSPQLRNDTLIATGPESVGISLFVTSPAVTVTIDATNVIAEGTHFDAEAAATPGGTAAIAFDHSNLDTSKGPVTATAGQTAPPLFVNAAAGDYREAPSSPTVDAGINDPANGTTDLAGDPRALPVFLTCGAPPPAITDIGAYEFVPTSPPCAPPVALGPPVKNPLQTRIFKAKIKGGRAKFRFAGSGGTAGAALEFSCKLDRRPWRNCRSPKTYRHLKPGRHTFRVRSQSAGTVDSTPAKRHFRIRAT
jgi:hypothetical protein